MKLEGNTGKEKEMKEKRTEKTFSTETHTVEVDTRKKTLLIFNKLTGNSHTWLFKSLKDMNDYIKTPVLFEGKRYLIGMAK